MKLELTLLKIVIHLAIRKEVSHLLAMVMATLIIDDNYSFDSVPKRLKERVLDCLKSLGFTIQDGELVAIEA